MHLTVVMRRGTYFLAAGGAAWLALSSSALLPRAQAQAPVATERIPVVDLDDKGPDLSDYVSPSLDPAERALVRAYINALPRSVKERIAGRPVGSVSLAVVDGATNVIHYNRPEEIGSYKIVPALTLPGSDRPDTGGSRPETKNPGVYGGSGPYRRIYTVPVPAAQGEIDESGPYYEQSGVVTTDCKSGTFNRGQDRGYAYLGGWSPTWNSVTAATATSSAIDAGLIYNLNASADSKDDYALFMNLGNHMAILSAGDGEKGTDPPEDYLLPPHIGCSERREPVSIANTAGIKFSVLGAPQLPSVAPECWHGSAKESDLEFYGFPIKACSTFAMLLQVDSRNFAGFQNSSHTGMILWVSSNIALGGWAKPLAVMAKYWNGKSNVPGFVPAVTCAGCVFKWMTSIAQTKQNLTDGAVYGAAWLDRKITGYALNLGAIDGAELVPLTAAITNCSEYPLWNPPYNTGDYHADCKNSPAGLAGVAKSVKVMEYAPEGEWDIIDLKP